MSLRQFSGQVGRDDHAALPFKNRVRALIKDIR
jgi:hypothetical protein